MYCNPAQPRVHVLTILRVNERQSGCFIALACTDVPNKVASECLCWEVWLAVNIFRIGFLRKLMTKNSLVGVKGVVLLVDVWTVVSFLLCYSPAVLRLFSRNALEPSDPFIAKGSCSFEFTCHNHCRCTR